MIARGVQNRKGDLGVWWWCYAALVTPAFGEKQLRSVCAGFFGFV